MFNKKSYVLRRLVLLFSILSLFFLFWPSITYSQIPPCPTGQTRCGVSCVDLRIDPHNCGACGNWCPTGYTCSGGVCQQQCPAFQTRCGNVCANLLTDPQNCGRCGNVCPPVANGVPGCGPHVSFTGPPGVACGIKTCLTGWADCDRNSANGCETNINTDSNNCGACGIRCPAATICRDGRCQPCPTGQTRCGVSINCIDLQVDPLSCGACGIRCPAATICRDGRCQLCPTGQTKCGNVCIDLQVDSLNCGGCGTVCAKGLPCKYGKCVDDGATRTR